jgi:transcriptional regulator with XRE-family HTH domain
VLHPERQVLARNLRKLREERGWTIAETARRCNVSPETIRRYELMRAGAYSATLKRVAKGFGLDNHDLWCGE